MTHEEALERVDAAAERCRSCLHARKGDLPGRLMCRHPLRWDPGHMFLGEARNLLCSVGLCLACSQDDSTAQLYRGNGEYLFAASMPPCPLYERGHTE